MNNFFTRAFLLLSIVVCNNVRGHWEQTMAFSHVEGKGLGYSIGYSSLKLFLSKHLNQDSLCPFLDLRGHVFNNGKYATNAVLGCRYKDLRNCIWGFNVAFDYLENTRHTYRQVGAGFEWIGEAWNIYLNQAHCRMAPLGQGGVVDSDGRVYGVKNLIVADNSIVPVPIDGSPMTSAYLIAWNIADIIMKNCKDVALVDQRSHN